MTFFSFRSSISLSFWILSFNAFVKIVCKLVFSFCSILSVLQIETPLWCEIHHCQIETNQEMIRLVGSSATLNTFLPCQQHQIHDCSNSIVFAGVLTWSPYLLEHIQLYWEEALEANLKQVEEDISAFATNDDWVLTSLVNGILMKHTSRMQSTVGLVCQVKLTNSAFKFILVV